MKWPSLARHQPFNALSILQGPSSHELQVTPPWASHWKIHDGVYYVASAALYRLTADGLRLKFFHDAQKGAHLGKALKFKGFGFLLALFLKKASKVNFSLACSGCMTG